MGGRGAARPSAPGGNRASHRKGRAWKRSRGESWGVREVRGAPPRAPGRRPLGGSGKPASQGGWRQVPEITPTQSWHAPCNTSSRHWRGRVGLTDENQPGPFFDVEILCRPDLGPDDEGEKAQGSIGLNPCASGGSATDSAMDEGPGDAGRRGRSDGAGNSDAREAAAARNVERAWAAVTRYGCGRGEGSEG